MPAYPADDELPVLTEVVVMGRAPHGAAPAAPETALPVVEPRPDGGAQPERGWSGVAAVPLDLPHAHAPLPGAAALGPDAPQVAPDVQGGAGTAAALEAGHAPGATPVGPSPVDTAALARQLARELEPWLSARLQGALTRVRTEVLADLETELDARLRDALKPDA